MADRTRLTTVEAVAENRSWLFTVHDGRGEEEVILVPCESDGDDAAASDDHHDGGPVVDGDVYDGGDEDDQPAPDVETWVNRCTHEAQRLDRGFGAAMRDGEVVCPKHGSMFDTCSGYCDNGEAAGTTLVSVDVVVEDGAVFLVDESVEFRHEGGIDDGGAQNGSDGIDGNDDDTDEDDGPSSTSHLSF